MVTAIKLLVAFIKIQIFFAKLFANADVLADLYQKLEELENRENEAE